LVGFFHERLEPVRNGFRVWVVYRVADAALLIGAVILHHLVGHGDFDVLLGHGSWPAGHADVSTSQALAVGLLFLIAAAGKSAMIPFSGWLPRAMEGPTPSSAVFYGSLSVHLGAFLLLRISPVLDVTPWLGAAVVVIGLTTAVFSAFACRVQTDIKSALSFAALTQVGIIFVEIGLGFRYLALIHILGHACLRTLQFLRAPSLLYDYRVIENAIGSNIPHVTGPWERSIPLKRRGLFYRLAMERGYLDVLLTDYLVHPFLRVLRVCDAVEKRWTDALDGGPSRESEQNNPPQHALEELL
jgi:NAD(P)H-quinone oxidoreductase subunit 5